MAMFKAIPMRLSQGGKNFTIFRPAIVQTNVGPRISRIKTTPKSSNPIKKRVPVVIEQWRNAHHSRMHSDD